MKRHLDKAQKILEEVEALDKEWAFVEILLPKASENRDQGRGYAAKLLCDSGCLETKPTDKEDRIFISGLTWAGHDLLDELRQDKKQINDLETSMEKWIERARLVMKGERDASSRFLFMQQLELYYMLQSIYTVITGEPLPKRIPLLMREASGQEFLIQDQGTPYLQNAEATWDWSE